MKFNIINCVIALLISGLIVFSMWDLGSNVFKDLRAIIAIICLSTSSILAIGVLFDRARTGTNIKTVAGIFFITFFLIQFIFSIYTLPPSLYLGLTLILLLLMTLIVRAVYKSMQ